jgi:CRP/FNR family transcriptional regulator, cyclic AMP receptor protein
MTIRTIAEYLRGHPFFAGFDKDSLDELAGCAFNQHTKAGEYLFHEGGDAKHFYVVTRGRIVVEVFIPASGPYVLDSVAEGDVLGWSGLIPPHRWLYDARAVEPASVVALDAGCLRAKCDADPRLGYDFIRRVAQMMSHRLQATRVRLLDLYGPPGRGSAASVSFGTGSGEAARPGRGPAGPA